MYRRRTTTRGTRKYAGRRARTIRRLSYGRKRTYRKRGGSRKMSRKSILNTTSRKKHDNMLPFANTQTNGNSDLVKQTNFFVNGSQGYAFCVWSPTARSLFTAGQTNTPIDVADRTATTCFMRGLRENIRIQTSSSVPWLWRRIVFTSKGPTFATTLSSDTAPAQPYAPYSDTSIGMGRLWFNTNINNMGQTQAYMHSVLFQGAITKDWNDIITARVDSSRVSPMYDKTVTIRTGNNNGYFAEKKLWHPFNKNIVYDDDESGASTTNTYFSTDAKPGMGDVYVVDIIVPGLGATTADILTISGNATLYWHER